MLLFCILLYLPGFITLPAVDRDEARFIQASRQMFEAPSWHGWVVPMVQDRPRLQKPPLIYWLQAGSAAILTRATGQPDQAWMYRVPSALAAIASVLFTMQIARRMTDRRVATLAGALLACCPVVFWEARQGRADMLLLACTTLAIWALWECIRRRLGNRDTPLRWAFTLWIAVALGILTKGPIILVVVLPALVAIKALWPRRTLLRGLHPITGLLLSLLPTAIWIIFLSREIDLAEYARHAWRETAGRAGSAMEGHWGPAGYHTLVAFAAFFPGSLMLGPGIVRAIRLGLNSTGNGWARIRSLRAARQPETFLLAVILPAWVIFECSGTKLPHYTLPLYPLLSILSARALLDAYRNPRLLRPVLRFLQYVFVCTVLAFLLLATLAAAFALLRQQQGSEAFGAVGIGAIALVLSGHLLWRAVVNRAFIRLQVSSICVFALAAATLGWSITQIPDLRVSRRLARLIDSQDPSASRPIAAVAFHEDSLIFETRARSWRVDEWKLKQWLTTQPNPLIVLDRERAEYWPRFRILGEVEGFNYSNGKRVELVVGEFVSEERMDILRRSEEP